MLNLIFKNKDLANSIILILIFLLPFTIVSGPFLPDLIITIFTLIFIFYLFKDKNFIYYIKKNYFFEIIFFLVFYILIILSLINSNYLSSSFLPSFFYFRFIFFTLIILYLLNLNQELLKFFTISIVLLFIVIFFDSIIQFTFGKNIFLQKYTDHRDVKIITSFFGDEKKLGSFISRFLPLVISLLILLDNKLYNKYKLKELLITLSIILIILSTERVAILNLLIFIFFYFFTLNKLKKVVFCLIFSIFAIIITYSFSNYFEKFYKSTYDQIFEKELVTNSPFSRYKEYKYSDRPLYFSRNHENMFLTSVEIFKENIFFGTGVKTFREECKKKKYNLEQRCSTHPHNTYIQLLSETGIFSFFIIFLVFLIYAFENFKIIFFNKMTKYNKIILINNVGIFIHLVPLIPSGSFYNNWMSCIFFINLAINLHLKKNLKKLISK